MARPLLWILGLTAMGCHPPPDALVDASRVVVVVGPPQLGPRMPRYAFRETPMQELDAAACADACKGVARAGERVTACYATPPHAFGTDPQPEAAVEPSSVRVCAIQ